MRVLVQRVLSASVLVENAVAGSIGRGYLLLVGIGAGDEVKEVERMAIKVVNLRVFEDEAGKMNLNILQAAGEALSVSQFTLYADTNKGHRPAFNEAAPPDKAKLLWARFNEALRSQGLKVQEGVFGAHMEVRLVNDGPVTILLNVNA